MRCMQTAILLALAAATSAATSWSAPTRLQGHLPRSLDDLLADGLDADPLDEFDRALFRPSDQQGRAGDLPDEGGDNVQQRLRRELGAGAETESDNPLRKVAQQMRSVEEMIGQSGLGLAAQELQEQIVADLDELIRQARKRCVQCKPGGRPGAKQGRPSASDSPPGPPRPKTGSGGSKQPGPTRANKDDNPNPGRAPVRRVDPREMQQMMRQLWGELPPRERERVMQSPPEEFLPKYELLIEQYFRRLAEEKARRMMIDD